MMKQDQRNLKNKVKSLTRIEKSSLTVKHIKINV